MSDRGWLVVLLGGLAFAYYRHRLATAPGIKRGNAGPPTTRAAGDPSQPGNFPYGE